MNPSCPFVTEIRSLGYPDKEMEISLTLIAFFTSLGRRECRNTVGPLDYGY